MHGEVSLTPERQAFYESLTPANLAPLWAVLKGMMPPEPKSKAVPFRWSYESVRPMLLKAGELLTAEEAERRVLVLENPSFQGMSRTTSTLYAGLQLILPGETAPAHRHTASALRFMIEGEGAFTNVDGERTTMRPGDFVITPNWAWHDHGHEGDQPCIWLDGLDVPIVQFFETIFSGGYDGKSQSVTRAEGDSLARFGSGLLPLDDDGRRYGATSPIFNYPFERTREALVAAAKGGGSDAHLGTTLRYANPVDGGWAMPTISTWMTHLQKGEQTKPMRSTDGIVMCVAEGTGEVKIGETVLTFAPHDVVAIPAWSWRSFKASSDCFLFCFSDRVIHEKLGFFREERS